MRFMVLSLFGFEESRFYGRVTAELVRLGHEAVHVTWSPRAAASLRRAGFRTYSMPDELERAGEGRDLAAEARRIEATYDLLSLRDVYRTDPPATRLTEAEAVERTVRHFLAFERIYDEVRPDVVVPEVGSETMRTAAHLVALERGIDVLFLFYTIFPRPLRLYANTMHAPIVPDEDVRPLAPAEREEVEAFIARFTAADKPIRAYRRPRVTAKSLRDFLRHVAVSATADRRNEYLRPQDFAGNYVREKARAALARRSYEPLGEHPRPFVYFPLHVTDDYKIKRVIPHCVDQAAIIELVAASLPQGVDLVLKEHPMSIGRNPLSLLRRLRRGDNIRLVDPYTSSHELIRRARAVAVISSTVGLEALLYGRAVMTLGQPFYSGFGVTVDVDSFREVPRKVAELLAFEPDRERTLQFLHAAMRRCYPGKPFLVDGSAENAVELGRSLHAAVSPAAGDRALISGVTA
ncbi:MAG TPA: hypothetical protein VN213_01985 [Solirubrobacteraceae bacterium]|nr:hypothetical protein [Solirubrobacteraceae bacterium]